MFGLFKRKPADHFSEKEKERIVQAIGSAERQTSGEVRIYIESHCPETDALARARELFGSLEMYRTAARNGVLVYLAMKDRKLAVFGDEGIHEKVGDAFWNAEVEKMLGHFNSENYTAGIVELIEAIGAALRTHFPFDEKTDTNELPDDIVFGK